MSMDDDDIWDEIVKTIKPLKGRAAKTGTADKKTKPRAVKKPVIAPPAIQKPAQESPLPQRRVKQLKQLKIPIDAKLDLHGFTLARAQKSLHDFIMRAATNNLRCIEVITGKGNPEKGTGQLRRHVPLWLGETGLKPYVLHIEENPASRGGSLLILLRRNKTNT